MTTAASIIFQRTLAKAEQACPEFEVKGHPSGGFTIAERAPGSSIAVYTICHSSKAYLEEVVKKKREAYRRAAFAGQLVPAS